MADPDWMKDIRALERLPKEARGASKNAVKDRNLAHRLRRARLACELSAAHKAELKAMADEEQEDDDFIASLM